MCAGQAVIWDGALRTIIGCFHRPPSEQGVSLLSAAERAIMDFTAQGLECKHIARQLGISVQTVYIHNKDVIRKLGITNRHAAAALWRDQKRGPGGPTPSI